MTRRALTQSGLRKAERSPRQRHASLSIDVDGHPRFTGRVSHPVVWFERSGYASTGDDEDRWYTSDDYTATTFVDGTPSLLLYFEARRLNSAVFALNLLPYQLERAIQGVQYAGLASLVHGALAEMRRQVRGSRHDTAALRTFLRRALSRRGTPDEGKRESRLDGALVRFERLPPWVQRLPPESRRVFEACLGRTYRVDEVTSDGLLVLDVSVDIDARFGGSMNDIRVESRYVRVIAEPAGGARRSGKAKRTSGRGPTRGRESPRTKAVALRSGARRP